MQGQSQSSTEMVSLTTLGSLSNDEANRLQLVNASEVHATGLSATPVIHQTPIKGSAGHKTSAHNTFATGVENEVKKYDVDVSVKIPHANWLRFT